MTLLNKYFFSFKKDLIAFTTFIPLTIAYLLCNYLDSDLLSGDIKGIHLVIGWVLVDGSHVYSSLFVTYFDKKTRTELPKALIILPLFFLVSATFFFYFGMRSSYIYFVAYLAAIHFIRQEYGWMKISSSFDKNLPRIINIVDKVTTYTMTIAPFLWLTRKSASGFWYEEGDSFLVPDVIANAGIYLFWTMVSLFLILNLYHSFKSKTFNLSKFLVFLNTFFGWYVPLVYIETGWIKVLYAICHHGVPYYFIVFHTERISQTSNFLKKLGQFRYLFFYLACAIFMFYFIELQDSSFIYRSRKAYPFLNAFLYAFFLTPQLVHFLIDAFIWKKRVGLVNAIGKS